MQYEMNDWMRYVPDDPVPVCALTSAQQERIRRLTMDKIQGKRPRRAWRAVLAAACAAVLLCGSVSILLIVPGFVHFKFISLAALFLSAHVLPLPDMSFS